MAELDTPPRIKSRLLNSFDEWDAKRREEQDSFAAALLVIFTALCFLAELFGLN